MSDPTVNAAEQISDSDLLAIRDVIRKEAADTAPAKAKSKRVKRQVEQPKVAPQPAAAQSVAPAPVKRRKPKRPASGKQPSQIAVWADIAYRFAYEKVTSYRPDRKSIFWTSLVLLVLLRPGLVFGWSLVAALSLLLFYLFMGPDRFWRWVIARFRRFARRRPEAARRLKCRAYVLARKWDSWLTWAPQGFADQFRSPDLREMIVADQRHAEIMAERLTQLERDVPVR